MNARKHIHIIGICGTFMGGVARLAKELGMQVSGSDANTYPPMSTQLESLGIHLSEGYRAQNIPADVDMVVVGNTISRSNEELEAVLDKGLAYQSGAQWLSENVLQGRWVLAVAGTHGKTTTSSMLAWILEDNQLSPGYLIGGVPENFGQSARLGQTPFFVIEADEYDTAFCDKRSKFVHYRPRTLVLNNLEFDHADIFSDLAAIQTQFHHLLKTIPSTGQIISNANSPALDEVLEAGYWSELLRFGPNQDWQASKLKDDASKFEIKHKQESALVEWSLIGDHNMANAVAAVAAAHHVGVPLKHACTSLGGFKSVKRRLERIYDHANVHVYDDFAHHPTAIAETVNALRNKVSDGHIIAVLEPRSNTMKRGVHKHLLSNSLQSANKALIFADNTVSWNIQELQSDSVSTYDRVYDLRKALVSAVQERDQSKNLSILIMSNGGFSGLHRDLVDDLSSLLAD